MYQAQRDELGRFVKGKKPWNAGKRKTGFRPTNGFQKGHNKTPSRPKGSKRIDRDGYTYIKVDDVRRWELLHRHVWESHNGPIPDGYIVIFMDGDKNNCDINNLKLISKRVNAVLNKNYRCHGSKISPEVLKLRILQAEIAIAARDKLREKQLRS